MASTGSVTHWIEGLKAGDPDAAQKLWERYWNRLVGLARRKLRPSRRRAAGEEDVAQNAFVSFWRGATQGRFPKLSDRDNLWGLLIVLTSRKAADQIEHEQRQKRGGGAVRGDSVFFNPHDPAGSVLGFDLLAGREPTPSFAARVAEEFERLLTLLDPSGLRLVAIWKMEGYTNTEVAGKLGCVVTTVERKLRMIRKIWQKEIAR
jgi:DNA-directed RNA polymerase specialized sigma24 family protein